MSAADFVALVVLGLAAWLWLDSLRAREAGVQAARGACRREGVQLLDDTVSIRSLRFGRDEDGRLRLQRVYDFEFSDSGDDRQQGSVMLLGREVVMLDVRPRVASAPTLH